jgi:hypothetical protein
MFININNHLIAHRLASVLDAESPHDLFHPVERKAVAEFAHRKVRQEGFISYASRCLAAKLPAMILFSGAALLIGFTSGDF